MFLQTSIRFIMIPYAWYWCKNTNTMFHTCNTYIIITLYISILQITPIYPTPLSIFNRLTSAKGLSVSYPTASFDIRRVRNRITLLHELRGCLVSLALLDRNMAPPAVKIGEHVATLSVNVVHMIWYHVCHIVTVAYCRILCLHMLTLNNSSADRVECDNDVTMTLH